MELQSLGKYRLVAPMQVHSSSCRFYLARHEDEPEEGAPSYLAKLLQPARDGSAERQRARFEHEIRLLKVLNHPSIPTLHAAGEQDGIAYIVMDRVDGVDLATLLGHRDGSPRALAKEVAVYIMGQLADALRHLHTLELMEDTEPEPLHALHRNLTPANVVLSRTGDAVLCGFGSATSRWLARENDEPGIGDPAYFSPERVVDREANVQTELFALAVMLWEMLRGERCLARQTDEATKDEIMRFDISQSSRRLTGLSPKLSEIVRKNLDRDPSRRYVSAYQLLQRLAQAPEAQAAEASRGELGRLVQAASAP